MIWSRLPGLVCCLLDPSYVKHCYRLTLAVMTLQNRLTHAQLSDDLIGLQAMQSASSDAVLWNFQDAWPHDAGQSTWSCVQASCMHIRTYAWLTSASAAVPCVKLDWSPIVSALTPAGKSFAPGSP